MSDYESVVLAALEQGSITIETPVTYSSMRRGVNKVIEIINGSAELMEDPTARLQGEIAVKLVRKGKTGNVFTITHYPEGRPLPECFKPRFTFKIVGDSNEDS